MKKVFIYFLVMALIFMPVKSECVPAIEEVIDLGLREECDVADQVCSACDIDYTFDEGDGFTLKLNHCEELDYSVTINGDSYVCGSYCILTDTLPEEDPTISFSNINVKSIFNDNQIGWVPQKIKINFYNDNIWENFKSSSLLMSL